MTLVISPELLYSETHYRLEKLISSFALLWLEWFVRIYFRFVRGGNSLLTRADGPDLLSVVSAVFLIYNSVKNNITPEFRHELVFNFRKFNVNTSRYYIISAVNQKEDEYLTISDFYSRLLVHVNYFIKDLDTRELKTEVFYTSIIFLKTSLSYTVEKTRSSKRRLMRKTSKIYINIYPGLKI